MKKLIILILLFFVLSTVSWSQSSEWLNTVIEVTGTGAVRCDANLSQAQQKLMAKRAALLDAYRQILEQVRGVRIDSQTTVQDLIVEYDEIEAKINGHIKGIRVLNTRYVADGTVEVDMALRISDLFECFEAHTFFQVPVLPGCSLFLIDCSGSMLDKSFDARFSNRWEMAISELKKAIQGLKLSDAKSNQYFGVIFFSDKIRSTYGLSVVSEDNKDGAIRFIEQQTPANATNYHAPLKQALMWITTLANENQTKTIYLLSDGKPNRGPEPFWYNVFELARSCSTVKLNTIYCGYADKTAETNMKTLAQIGGGVFDTGKRN